MTTYKEAGVDIDKGNEAKKRIKEIVKQTHNKNVLKGIGSFGGFFSIDKEKFNNPVLVSSVDGVGTKLKLAFNSNKHDTVGQDLVNHCVNDILCQGATPLFFMDYIALGKMKPQVVEQLITGLSKACKENNTALIGGETAEMPGFYKEDEYDLASFIVGVVEKDAIIDGSTIAPGDAIIGLASNGLHTNGYSLAQKVIFDIAKMKMSDKVPEGSTVQEELMKVHKSYLKTVLNVMKKVKIKGIAHITGGGLVENIPRSLPDNCNAEIKRYSWKKQPIFDLIQKKGNVPEDDMFRTFNMGVGMVLVVSEKDAKTVQSLLDVDNWVIGKITKGNKEVVLK